MGPKITTMAGAKTASLGRMLTGLGALWMGWAIFTGLFQVGSELEDLGLPFLPGLLFFIVGRAMTKAVERRPLPEPGPSWQQPEVEPRMAPPQRPAPRPEPERRFELQPEMEREPVPELPDLEEEILEPPPPMTSEEMVADARRRFGPHPIEEDEED